MNSIQRRLLTQTIAFIILIIMVTTFLGFIGGKFERVQQAAMTGDQQTIREETQFVTNIGANVTKHGTKLFLIAAGVLIAIIGGAYALQGNKEKDYEKTLRSVADLHGLAYYKENRFSNPTITGSDHYGLLMIETETTPDNKKRTVVTLGLNYQSTAVINPGGQHEMIGSQKTLRKITAPTKNLLNNTDGRWNIKAGELRYEHPGIAESEEQLNNIITAGKRLRKDLAQM